MPRQTRQSGRRMVVAHPSPPAAPASFHLADLPEAVLCRICSFLPLRTLAAVPSVSRACSQALTGQYSHLVWRPRLRELEKRLGGVHRMEWEESLLRIVDSMPPYPGPPPPGLEQTKEWEGEHEPGLCRFDPETAQPQYLFHSAAEMPKVRMISTNISYVETKPLSRYTPVWVGLDLPHDCAACGGLRFDTHATFKEHCCNSAMHAELVRPPGERLPLELRDPRCFDPAAWAALPDHQRFSRLYTYQRRALALLRAPLSAAYAHDPAAKAGRLTIQRTQDWVARCVENSIAQQPGLSRRERADARARCSREQVAKVMVAEAEQKFFENGLVRNGPARSVCIGGYGDLDYGGEGFLTNFMDI